ncbi:cellulose synthase catalytic subunit domain protein [Escherichia coli LT-68]|nr:cellulose synthase catalytic subunit domain protein [Escherichia coli LT-68]
MLIPPVNARLIGRYRDYRRHGASAFSATLGCFWMILAWIFIPLEHPRWQRIRAEHKNLYPHINASRPRPLDPVRYLIQTCWLLIGTSRKETPKPRRRAFSGLQNIRGRYHQWMNELPERVSHKTQHLDEKKELGHLSAGALLGANVDCAVADRFLPLYLVALHLYAELGRSGQPGVRAYSALR